MLKLSPVSKNSLSWKLDAFQNYMFVRRTQVLKDTAHLYRALSDASQHCALTQFAKIGICNWTHYHTLFSCNIHTWTHWNPVYLSSTHIASRNVEYLYLAASKNLYSQIILTARPTTLIQNRVANITALGAHATQI